MTIEIKYTKVALQREVNRRKLPKTHKNRSKMRLKSIENGTFELSTGELKAYLAANAALASLSIKKLQTNDA